MQVVVKVAIYVTTSETIVIECLDWNLQVITRIAKNFQVLTSLFQEL